MKTLRPLDSTRAGARGKIAQELTASFCSQRVSATPWLPAVSLVAGLTFWAGLPEARTASPEPTAEPFKLTNIHFETNGSACDMGIQMLFDTDGIIKGSVRSPNGRRIYGFKSKGGMADIGGQTEGFLEGVEPQITELLEVEDLGCERSDEEEEISLEELLTAWPAGTYLFEGQSREGVAFEGEAILTHRIPARPNITEPAPGTVVPADEPLLIKWDKVRGAILPGLGPVRIVGYHVVVGPIDVVAPPRFDVDVPRDVLSMTVPEQFLQPNTVYEFEVFATEKSGNQTFTEGLFCTEPITELIVSCRR
jgi:hypothetical protein